MNVEDLERRERDAVLAGDEAALKQLWDEQLIVNAPNNAVVSGRAAVLELVRLGIIRYARFERQIDRVELFGDVAVTMGSEKVQPIAGPLAGKLVERRYTNVWRQADGEWRMCARHANVIVGEQDLGPRS